MGRVRENNEDAIYLSPSIPLFAVADGMGGHSAGEVASALAIRAVQEAEAALENAGSDGDEVRRILSGIVDRAQELCISYAQEHREAVGLGTTLSAVYVAPSGSLFGVHIGDSRVYLADMASMRPLTNDHSEVFRMVARGYITREQARTHRKSNLITKCIVGVPGRFPDRPDVFTRPATPQTRLVLCTDGFSDMLPEEYIEPEVCRMQVPPTELVDRLIALALESGGRDNVSVIVVDLAERSHSEG